MLKKFIVFKMNSLENIHTQVNSKFMDNILVDQIKISHIKVLQIKSLHQTKI